MRTRQSSSPMDTPGRRVGAEIENDEEGEMEVDPIFVFIMNDKNCQEALAVPGAPVGPHQDPHISAMKYIVQEMSLLVGFSLTKKHLIRRSTGPPPIYDYWCVRTLTPRQAKLFQYKLEDYFTTGPPAQVPLPVQLPPPAQVQTSQWSLAVETNRHNRIGAVYRFGGSESYILHGLLAKGGLQALTH